MDRSVTQDAAAGRIAHHPDSEILFGKGVARCILTRKSRSTQSRLHSDFRMAVKSIGPAPAQCIYCAGSDKMTTQVASSEFVISIL
jgi:hypothetical protein